MKNSLLLDVRDLSINFRIDARDVPAVRGVNFQIQRGEVLAVVGESGSGKTTMALGLCKLLPSPPAVYTSGEVLLEGKNLHQMREQELRSVRGARIGYIFQEPSIHFNPVLTVGRQILEVLKEHRPESASIDEVTHLLRQVRIPNPDESTGLYPFQLSGGLQQRALIAMALAGHPTLLVADEPTSALDTSTQQEILTLLRDLQKQFRMSILFISHHLGVVSQFADTIAVMYAGRIVEYGPARQVVSRPLHPYTIGLVHCVPQVRGEKDLPTPIPGGVPEPSALPSGCKFHPRCFKVHDDCKTTEPDLAAALNDRYVRCPYWK